MGIFDHSSKNTFVWSHTDVGRKGLAYSVCFNSSQRCWGCCQVEVRTIKFFHTKLHYPWVYMSLWSLLCALVRSHFVTGRAIPELFPQRREHEIVQSVLV